MIKVTLLSIGAIIALIGGGLLIRSRLYSHDLPEQSVPPEHDVIVIYNQGKEVRLLSDSTYFPTLKAEIEQYVMDADGMYRIILNQSRLDRIKRRNKAVELLYAVPASIKINVTNNLIVALAIFIPLTGKDVPRDVAFVYSANSEPPLNLSNSKQTKERLLEIVGAINKSKRN